MLNSLIKQQENSKSKALVMLDKIQADIEKAKAKVNVIPLAAGNARAMMNQLVPPFGNPKETAPKKKPDQDRFKTAADLGYVWEGKEQALREIKEAQEAYNVEMLARHKRLQPKLDALPKDATVEQISKVLNEGKEALPW